MTSIDLNDAACCLSITVIVSLINTPTWVISPCAALVVFSIPLLLLPTGHTRHDYLT